MGNPYTGKRFTKEEALFEIQRVLSAGLSHQTLSLIQDILARVKRVKTIEIQPIQFPNWAEFDKTGKWKRLGEVNVFISIDTAERLCCCTSFLHIEYFPNTEQGYKQACKWIEEKRLELITDLCKGVAE